MTGLAIFITLLFIYLRLWKILEELKNQTALMTSVKEENDEKNQNS